MSADDQQTTNEGPVATMRPGNGTGITAGNIAPPNPEWVAKGRWPW